MPALAAAGTLLASTLGFNSNIGSLVKINPTFPCNQFNNSFNSGFGAPNFFKSCHSSPLGSSAILNSSDFLIKEFFPIIRYPPFCPIKRRIY